MPFLTESIVCLVHYLSNVKKLVMPIKKTYHVTSLHFATRLWATPTLKGYRAHNYGDPISSRHQNSRTDAPTPLSANQLPCLPPTADPQLRPTSTMVANLNLIPPILSI